MKNERSEPQFMKDGSLAPRKHVGRVPLPGVWKLKPGRSPSVPTKSNAKSRERSSRRDSTNGWPGMRAYQRAAATGKPVDHRHRGLERETPESKAKRRAAKEARKAAAS